MPHNFIKKLQPGIQLDDIYLVSQPILRSTSKGDLYIAMYLADRTGKLNGRMWQATEAIYNSLPTEGFVHIIARTETYQNALQIVVNKITTVDTDKVNLEDYLPRTEKDVDKMFTEVKNIIATIKNPDLKALIEAFLEDAELAKQFRTAPAAMTLHHGYLGGLLEHTLNILKAAQAVLPLYPEVQADLVLAGVFFHDLGKIKELSYKTAFSYTDQGQLVGHIVQTVVMLNKKADALAAKGTKINPDILANLEHIIVTHHGQYEFGSPKLPATAEAFMVNYLDDLDAKMNQVKIAIENDPGNSDWTIWKNHLQTRLYRKKVIE